MATIRYALVDDGSPGGPSVDFYDDDIPPDGDESRLVGWYWLRDGKWGCWCRDGVRLQLEAVLPIALDEAKERGWIEH